MIEVLRTSMVHHAHFVQALLQSSGIEASVRGEQTVGFGVPASVWVSDDDEERAREVVRESEAP